MRVAIYARVSTTDQTCDLQLRELRQYILARGWETVGEYVDTGWSGAAAARPELDRLLADARMRRFDVVLVWKLDRWGRSVAASVKSIQELASLGVRFIAMTQNIDTDDTNPMSRFLLHILAAFAELERELIRERVTAGVRAAKARGKQVGRPKRIFRRDEVVRLRADGVSWRDIAKALGIPVATLIDAHRTTETS
jgi:DNA invertase Pin-like site-specific DNA recombinase